MKTFLIIAGMLFIFSMELHAQTPFIRIYNKHNQKIAAGKFLQTAGDKLLIKTGSVEHSISISQISYLKTGRSGGHNICTFSCMGLLVGALVGISSEDEGDLFTKEQTTGLGALSGAVGGALLGVFSLSFKSSELIQINSDPAKMDQWKSGPNKQQITQKDSYQENYRRRKYNPY
jgi:hypothetical protein